MCGVQGDADRGGHPLAAAAVRSAGVRQDRARQPLLAPGLHAALLRFPSVCGSLCLGLST